MDDEELRRRSALIASALERDGEGMDDWLATLPPGDEQVISRALAKRHGDDSLAGVSSRRFAHLLSSAVGGNDKPAAGIPRRDFLSARYALGA